MKTILIKAGGSILEDEKHIEFLSKGINALKESGYQIILVHGGGKAISEALAIYQIRSEFINGLRLTSAEAIKIIEMVLCGKINPLLVRKLNHIGLNATGFSGAQNQLFLCDYYSDLHGFVGKITKVNPNFLKDLMNSLDTIPVIASLGCDNKGNPLNINADLAASHLANCLAVDQLIFLTDQRGIYNEEGKVLTYLSENQLEELIQNSTVKEGMLVKAKAILTSLKAGLEPILVLNGKQENILLDAVLKQKKVGTLCR